MERDRVVLYEPLQDHGCEHRALHIEYMFTSQLLTVLTVPTQGGWPGCIDIVGWLYTKMVYQPAGSY